MELFTGSGVAIVTPFTEDNQVNFEKLGELIDWHIAQSTDAIIVCGTTGEAPTLHDDEHKAAIEFTVKHVNKRVQVIAGTGSNFTAHAIEMSQFAESVGADAVLCVTPYYNKATQKGLIKHFTEIADAINIPVILYSVASRTGVNIEPQTVLELSKHPMIKAIKEASGNIAQCLEIARLVPSDFKIYSGNDDMIVPLMSLGASGVISVLANVLPKETHDMVASYLEGDHAKSLRLQKDVKGLVNALFCEVNPIPVKTALNLMGLQVGNLRAPLYEMEAPHLEQLKAELRPWHLLKESV